VTGASTTTSAKAASCLLSPTCLGLGADVLSSLEGSLEGIKPYNLYTQPGMTSFSYGLAVGMLIVDAVLYFILALYLDQVLPSEVNRQTNPLHYCLNSAF